MAIEEKDTKLKLHSPDLTQANIEKLAELFPSCVTEVRDDSGNLKQGIDFDLLRQELSDYVVEGPRERYQLTWPGKREALLRANAPIGKTFRPCREESVDFDATENLFIEGDNLDTLKLLQETYLNKIRVIYIDPPYNTGNDFIYKDNFAQETKAYLARSGQLDDVGSRLSANTESNGRFHSDWLTMLYPRLKIAQRLLSEDGVMFISMDDHEIGNLRKLCEEVFGQDGVLGCIVSRRRQVPDNRNYTRVSSDHEYVLICGKSQSRLRGKEKDLSKYSNTDGDPKGPWMSDNLTGLASREQRPNLHYDVVNPATGQKYPPHPGRGWAYEKKRMEQFIEEGRILWPSKPSGRPRIKRYLSDLADSTTGFSTVQELGYTTDGTREITKLLGFKAFDFPKPVKLGTALLAQLTNEKDPDIVLDFFAGSATTAHAVMALNAKDGGKRRYIMVQLPEPIDPDSEAGRAGYRTIADLAKERIRRAAEEIKSKSEAQARDFDSGFRVLKVDTSNMKDVYYTPDGVAQTELLGLVDNIKHDRSDEDLLFQVLVDWGVDLALPIRSDIIAGKKVYFVDQEAVAACFQADIDEVFVKELAERKPLRVVFRDRGYSTDSSKINVEQIFKLISPATEVKTI